MVASEDEEEVEEEAVQNDGYGHVHASGYAQQAHGDAYGQQFAGRQAYRHPNVYQEQDYEMAQRAALGLRGRPAKVLSRWQCLHACWCP